MIPWKGFDPEAADNWDVLQGVVHEQHGRFFLVIVTIIPHAELLLGFLLRALYLPCVGNNVFKCTYSFISGSFSLTNVRYLPQKCLCSERALEETVVPWMWRKGCWLPFQLLFWPTSLLVQPLCFSVCSSGRKYSFGVLSMPWFFSH